LSRRKREGTTEARRFTYLELQSTVNSITYKLPIGTHVMNKHNKCLKGGGVQSDLNIYIYIYIQIMMYAEEPAEKEPDLQTMTMGFPNQSAQQATACRF